MGDLQSFNIGTSNYKDIPKGFQPWDKWKLYKFNDGWRPDLIKRLFRKKPDGRLMDIQKMEHIIKYMESIRKEYIFYTPTVPSDISEVDCEQTSEIFKFNLYESLLYSLICQDDWMNIETYKTAYKCIKGMYESLDLENN